MFWETFDTNSDSAEKMWTTNYQKYFNYLFFLPWLFLKLAWSLFPWGLTKEAKGGQAWNVKQNEPLDNI